MGNVVLESIFPKLINKGYEITSPINRRYNCIAWAAKDDIKWWWPDSQNNYFWPDEIPRHESIECFIAAYQLFGYSVCENGILEEGYEKVAIFTDQQNRPTHAARQLPSGKWTSKLGELEDIEHELEGVEGVQYGNARLFLRKRI
jgi:hypothetical protein